MGTKYHFFSSDSHDSDLSSPASTSRTYATAMHETAIGISSVQGFKDALDGLMRSNARISSLIIETHGSPGAIYFGNERFDGTTVDGWLAGQSYDQLFEPGAHVVLNGCNVAEGNAGTQFLAKLGAIFFQRGGGSIEASTSIGLAWFFNGKVYHLWGDTKTLYFASGGVLLEVFEQ